MKTKTLFVGSNWEALSTFKTLNEDQRFELVGLITQPDRPVGRKKEVLPSEIKNYAIENNIPVIHTENKKEKYKEALERFEPELIVCKSFGEMLPGFFMKYPKYSAINVHYSLLPKYRGAVPIQKAILEGDPVTGITYVKMVRKLDAGPILKKIEAEIHPNDTNQTLRERLVEMTHDTIGDVLEGWVKGEIELEQQIDDDATYCQQSDISKDNAYIDFTQTDPSQIERMTRALLPWPVVWTYYEGKRMKIFQISIEHASNLTPGEYGYDGEDLFVGTIDSGKTILLKDIQQEGKKRMTGKQFALGKNFKKI